MHFKKLLRKLHRVSLRGKILIALIVIMGLFLYKVNFSTKYFIVEKQGQDQIDSILKGAHNYFYDKLESMTYLFGTLTLEMEAIDLDTIQRSKVYDKIRKWPREYQPDIFFVTDQNGKVLYSKNSTNLVTAEYKLKILQKALVSGEVNGIEVLEPDFLETEGLSLAGCVEVVPTLKATDVDYDKECRAMAMMATQPIHNEGRVIGFAVIGKMINNSTFLVDNIRANFDVRSTIFLDKVRVATNVLNDQGDRAIGTLLSDTVYEQVIKNGERYLGRAFVVNDWYITAYEPIKDVEGKVVGSLYVGAPEKPLLDIQQAVNNEITVTLALAVIIFSIAILWLYRSIVKPIQEISAGAVHVARGDFTKRFHVSDPNKCWDIKRCYQRECPGYQNETIRCWLIQGTKCRSNKLNLNEANGCLKCEVYNIYSGNEIERLTDAINYMVNGIDERTQALENLNRELEGKNKELSDSRDELESQKDELIRLNKQLQESMKALDDSQNIIYALAVAVEAKDPYTRGHSERVAEYSLKLAKQLGIEGHELEVLKGAALLHDIGKIGISGNILRKPGTLSTIEFQQVRKHPGIGERICLSLKFAQEMLPIIRHHHEHYNGQGYPDGLREDNIPLLARIIAVADAFDAMTSDRPYRSGMPVEEALKRLENGAGTQWDPELIPIFIENIKSNMLKGLDLEGKMAFGEEELG